MNYYKDGLPGDISGYPQWSQDRMTFFNDLVVIDAIINENNSWVKYYEIRGDIKNIVLHKERILEMEKQKNILREKREIGVY